MGEVGTPLWNPSVSPLGKGRGRLCPLEREGKVGSVSLISRRKLGASPLLRGRVGSIYLASGESWERLSCFAEGMGVLDAFEDELFGAVAAD